MYDFAGNLVDNEDEDDKSEIDFNHFAIKEGGEEINNSRGSDNEDENEEKRNEFRKELLSAQIAV